MKCPECDSEDTATSEWDYETGDPIIIYCYDCGEESNVDRSLSAGRETSK